LIIVAKQRISRGEVPKRTQQTLTPLEFLKNMRDKLASDGCDNERKRKAKREDEDASINPEESEEGEGEDTDLEKEAPEDNAAGEAKGSKGGKKKKEA
jgi:hypothetical protein